MAVAEGFEPSDGGYPSHAFEACSLGRSDTPPRGSLPVGRPPTPIAIRAIADTWPVTNRIQALLDVEYPVVQAPMTYIARAELAAAVSEGGRLGDDRDVDPRRPR